MWNGLLFHQKWASWWTIKSKAQKMLFCRATMTDWCVYVCVSLKFQWIKWIYGFQSSQKILWKHNLFEYKLIFVLFFGWECNIEFIVPDWIWFLGLFSLERVSFSSNFLFIQAQCEWNGGTARIQYIQLIWFP